MWSKFQWHYLNIIRSRFSLRVRRLDESPASRSWRRRWIRADLLGVIKSPSRLRGLGECQFDPYNKTLFSRSRDSKPWYSLIFRVMAVWQYQKDIKVCWSLPQQTVCVGRSKATPRVRAERLAFCEASPDGFGRGGQRPKGAGRRSNATTERGDGRRGVLFCFYFYYLYMPQMIIMMRSNNDIFRASSYQRPWNYLLGV